MQIVVACGKERPIVMLKVVTLQSFRKNTINPYEVAFLQECVPIDLQFYKNTLNF
jgi:hypothetical protein